ncbi:MAG: hypothetical protein M0Z59_05370, partial [Nitrospiraceae bacterium]|nr:hypothetical protein [Nitrospiraceae bacterium]
MRALAEAIILQSLEDLWDSGHRDESLEFFHGEGFGTYADLAGLGPAERAEIMKMFGAHMG